MSEHACRSEVIGTLFKLVLTALEHEARELFSVNGVAPFNPHTDVGFLEDLQLQGRLETRETA